MRWIRRKLTDYFGSWKAMLQTARDFGIEMEIWYSLKEMNIIIMNTKFIDK